jgi:hypothetical protein
MKSGWPVPVKAIQTRLIWTEFYHIYTHCGKDGRVNRRLSRHISFLFKMLGLDYVFTAAVSGGSDSESGSESAF